MILNLSKYSWVCAGLWAALGAGCGGGSVAAMDAGAPSDVATDIASAEVSVDAAPRPPRLTLNDVSVLLPLPRDGAATGYLRPTDQGAAGELLPRDVYDLIPPFPVTPTQGLDYARMRVVAVRFDGCGGPPGVCRPEIRVVMQPISGDGSTRDSALHLFYRLDETVMAEVVRELRALRALAPEVTEGPLDVHPALAAQGVDGAYGAGLRALLLRHIGSERLERVTFFLRAPPVQEVWFFGGFDRVDGVYEPMNIVGVGRSNQRVIRTEDGAGYRFDLTPVGITPEDGRPLLSAASAAAATDEVRRATLASYLRVENPSRYVPDELPCAGCHLAAFITAETSRVHGLATVRFEGDRYASTRDLSMRGGAAERSSSLRAFGWFDAEPMIAQRTINESAAVVDHLESRYPAIP